MSTVSTLAIAHPGKYPTFPASMPELTCNARLKSGLGNLVKSPSLIIFLAPPLTSSAGSRMSIKVPLQSDLFSISCCAAPMSTVI